MNDLRPISETRVVHVSSAHPVTDNRIHYRECSSLVEAGYEVTLIAVESEVHIEQDQVRVLAIPKLPRLKRMFISGPRAVLKALKTGGEVFHLHDPELVWAVPVLRLMRKNVVYDAHEDLPVQVAGKSYINGFVRPLAVVGAHLIVMVARKSTHIIAATETIAARFPKNKTSIVHNYPPLREEEDVALDPSERENIAVFAGGISSNRGAEVMVSSVRDQAFPDEWSLTLAGTISVELRQELEADEGWQKTSYLGQIAPMDARDLLLKAKVGLVLLEDTEAHRDALPTKMFEYFAAGLPVIASDFPLWRTIVHEHECGILVDPSSPKEVAEAVQKYSKDIELLRLHSANARRLAVEKLNWGSEATVLKKSYLKVLGREM